MKIEKVKQLGVVLLGAFVVSGCPSPTVNQLMASGGSVSQNAMAHEVVNTKVTDHKRAANNKDLAEVSFDVCANVEDWQRPSQTAQDKRLSSNARYGESLADGALKDAYAKFRDQQVISFTTYGLSARIEPEDFSGAWTAIDEMASCYQPDTVTAINQGDRAETWLLNQRISNLQWEGDRYIMTVEPARTGLQVIQFNRVDEMASLPLDVVTASGSSVDVVSGDWQ